MDLNVQSVASGAGYDSASSTQSPGQTLGKEDFLKLLVAELQNQDPTQQTDNTQYIAQMAQFSLLEQMQNVDTDIQKLNALMQSVVTVGLLSQGSNLIGKEVTGTDPNTGQTVSGVVSGVRVDGTQVILEPMEIPLENVNKVTKEDVQQ